jgi:hypothetical protein
MLSNDTVAAPWKYRDKGEGITEWESYGCSMDVQ